MACMIERREFQLTHPWGCDSAHFTIYFCHSNFNSHTREGVTSISERVNPPPRFQLTHPWGCDQNGLRPVIQVVKFQLTHPWGCDSPPELSAQAFCNFNSHTREGVTAGYKCSNCGNDFNSHTREGVTMKPGSDPFILINFNSHTREGVTPMADWLYYTLTYFNSHTREGVTNVSADWLFGIKISTHTPVRVWREFFSRREAGGAISTHTPVRVWQ